ALIIRGFDPKKENNDDVLKMAAISAHERLAKGNWPKLHFGSSGNSGPNLKRHLKYVKKGKVALTYWADDIYDEPVYLASQSWNHKESGHSQTGINELDAIVGKDHGFDTVKPLKLFEKIIQLWCPPH